MRFHTTALLATLLAVASSVPVAGQEFGLAPGQTPVLETGVGYTFLHANAPPAQCGCFSANGGYASAAFSLPRGFSLVADLSAVHAPNLSGTTQTITVFHYLFGPRYSLRHVSKRFVPYVQALGGGAQETSNYAFVQNATAVAFSAGGGVSTRLSDHFAWTIGEADWVSSRLPNGGNNIQNDLRVSSGFTFRLGPR